MLLIINLITLFSSLLVSSIPGLVITVILTPALSMARAYLFIAKGFEINLTDTFSGFDDYFSAFKVNLLSEIITFLYSLIVPGIIRAIEYSFVLLVLAENKGKSARE